MDIYVCLYCGKARVFENMVSEEINRYFQCCGDSDCMKKDVEKTATNMAVGNGDPEKVPTIIP